MRDIIGTIIEIGHVVLRYFELELYYVLLYAFWIQFVLSSFSKGNIHLHLDNNWLWMCKSKFRISHHLVFLHKISLHTLLPEFHYSRTFYAFQLYNSKFWNFFTNDNLWCSVSHINLFKKRYTLFVIKLSLVI